jgi:hypothetical protein
MVRGTLSAHIATSSVLQDMERGAHGGPISSKICSRISVHILIATAQSNFSAAAESGSSTKLITVKLGDARSKCYLSYLLYDVSF